MAFYAVGALVIGVASYAQQAKAASRQRAAADNAAVAAQADAAANRQAADAASAREQTAAQVKANEATAAAQLATQPEVTTDSGLNAATQRRRVQATFNVADGGAGGAAVGSIRV